LLGVRRSNLMAGIQSLQQRVAPFRHHIVLFIGATLLGFILAGIASQIEPDHRITVGNTGGTLSVLVEIPDARVLVGAGPSRSHAADLIGRSTRPWDREIDLLVIPGWDDRHTPGATGLLERQSINGIAIVGLLGDEPSWTLLEREAEQRGVAIVYVDRPSNLNFDKEAQLAFSSLAQDPDGAWIRLEHLGKRIDIVDTNDIDQAVPDPRAFEGRNDHLFINMRGQNSPNDLSPIVLVVPEPFWQRDFDRIDSPYFVSLARNEHLRIHLSENEIRLPLDAVSTRPD
jgi:hypothetical protein